MRIGILTFHWATNYGAILQAFCLQEYLEAKGHEVEIINYKPQKYDFSWMQFVKHPKRLLKIRKIILNQRKESKLSAFRNQYLHLTKRFKRGIELLSATEQYDLVISGSDQILNPTFTLFGEDNKPNPTYYLKYCKPSVRKIGYAVSFGCESYPSNAKLYAEQWINNFDVIGTREKSGINILNEMGYKEQCLVVPDPTLLIGQRMFSKFKIYTNMQKEFTCVYMLRKQIQWSGRVRYIDEKHKVLSMEQWLTTISQAKRLITNSYHGMIIAILSQVPFAVLLEDGGASGMNDRFETLLARLGIEERMTKDLSKVKDILEKPINFNNVGKRIDIFAQVGKTFLNHVCSNETHNITII